VKTFYTMTSWMPSFGGILRRSRSEAEALNPTKVLSKQQLSLDLDCLPEVNGESEVLSSDDMIRLNDSLPPRIIGTTWTLIFSTSLHGFSLSSLYRKCNIGNNSPTLLCIEDTKRNVFGALLSCPIKLHDQFYGTGESFLFVCKPDFKVYNWSGENQHFTRGNTDSLLVGAGEGQFGLWLDSSLFQGRSQTCSTYRNRPLVSGGGDFVVKTLECWTFE